VSGCGRWDSNPAPGCFAVEGQSGEWPLTCDADSPALTARAHRGPAVTDVARTQHGPWPGPGRGPEERRETVTRPRLVLVEVVILWLKRHGRHANLHRLDIIVRSHPDYYETEGLAYEQGQLRKAQL